MFRRLLCRTAVAIAANAPAQQTRPTLQVANVEPVVIRGIHFKPGERVRLAGLVNRTQIATNVRSTASGTFAINLGRGLSLAGCSGGASLKATGSLGSVSILKIPPKLC